MKTPNSRGKETSVLFRTYLYVLGSRVLLHIRTYIDVLGIQSEILGDRNCSSFDSMDQTLKCDHSLKRKAVEQYFNAVLFVFKF